MESDAFALRTALFVVMAAVLTVITWTVFRETRFVHKPYLVVTEESVSGLSRKARIYYKGVEVGAVADIFFLNNNFDQVQILIHVDESIPIARNTYAQLALRGITGEYDLRLNNDGALGEPLPTSIERPAVIAMRSETISKLGDSLEQALVSISDTSDRVSDFLTVENEQNVKRLLTTAGDTAEQLGDLQRQLEPTLQGLPELVDETSRTLEEYQTLAASLAIQTEGIGALVERLTAAAAGLDNLSGALQSQTANNIDQSLVSISATSRELQRVLEDIRQDPQRLLLGAPRGMPGPGERDQEPQQ